MESHDELGLCPCLNTTQIGEPKKEFEFITVVNTLSIS